MSSAESDALVLPAYAGMIPSLMRLGLAAVGAPRIRGDDPYTMLDNLKLG